MKSFDFLQPRSVDEAISTWTADAAYLGGGTNLLDLMKIGVAQPTTVIDLSRIPGLDAIDHQAGGGVRIGAMVRNADLVWDADVVADFPMVAEAILSGASGQLRNAATVGGNLMQQTRCAYFQDSFSACNRREPGAGCAAKGGVDGAMAVLGWTDDCIATNPSDFAVPLMALDAVVEVQGPNGKRELPLSHFYGDDAAVNNTLQEGELILALRLPASARNFSSHARYVKLRERTSFAFALVSAAAALRIEGGVIAEARLALGAVAARPWRVAGAEELLKGRAPTAEAFADAAARLLEGARPSGANGHKIELARRIAIRALTLAAAGTPVRIPALPASVVEEPFDA
ncbi:MAG: xanthine dehydrogenase family protein subunit M [Pseudomonadota bacterium]